MASNVPVTLDTLITVKIHFQGSNKKFKIPLRDLGASVLPEKLRSLLQVKPEDEVVFERYSDSAGAYVTLDSNKPQVYKTLFRAAKAKLKLRLKASVPGQQEQTASSVTSAHGPYPSLPASSLHTLSADTVALPGAAQVSPVIAQSPAQSHVSSTYKKPQVESAETSPVSTLLNRPDAEGEAPVPRSFTARHNWFNGLADASRNADLAFRPKNIASPPRCSWMVYCNACNLPMENDHFHCSICDHGDYDLCPSCVDNGIHCPGTGHWMVKRFVKNGSVVNSTTERVGPKPKPQPQTEKEMPGAFTDEKPAAVHEQEQPSRTCNCCVKVLPEKEFVTCTSCDDYDLCVECHINNTHGHHPGHAFEPATSRTALSSLAEFLCKAGRNVRHSAVCDGCERFIYGVRHKCLSCPDWDYCSDCVKSAKYIHPRHRFVPIYQPLAEPAATAARHYGIYCDGPLCKDKEHVSYIEGVRYKCAVCHDTDFCASCEAIPSNQHNRTHPLIKFKTPVRSVSVTTLNEDKTGQSIARVGDRAPTRRSTATETSPMAPSTNASTQVHTIVDVKPTEENQPKVTKEKIEIRDLLSEPVQEPTPVPRAVDHAKVASPKNADELDAHFVRDTILDGSKICANSQFVQTWTLRNPGPLAWPAGCSVRHVGGDNMLNLDNSQPLSQSELADASESNVIDRSVAPGEEIAFRVVMKAPKRHGTAISYWRLKSAEGAPFGHRLWCDIEVVPPPTPFVATPSADPSPEPAEASTATPSILNSTPKDDLTDHDMLHAQSARQAALARIMLTDLVGDQESIIAAVPVVKSEQRVSQDAAALVPETRQAEGQSKPQSSGMIFPQLDKESPASSTHEAVASQVMSPRSETDPSVARVEEDLFEDAESVEICSVSSDEDGFLTDEEYDILDASDEELP